MMESAKAVYPEVGVYVCVNEATGQCRISYELETDVDVSEICLYMTMVLNTGAVCVCVAWNSCFRLIFSTRAMQALYMLSSCVHLSVGLSIRLPQVGVLQRWLNVGSHKQRHTIARRL